MIADATESMTPLSISDPTYRQAERYGPLDRLLLRYINDPRDLPFLHLSLAITFILGPCAVLLYVPGIYRWWMGIAYVAFNFFVFFDRYILMLHNTSHRPLFKRKYRLANRYIPWALGPLFGETPDTYYVHHIGMHHPENNLSDDLSSTIRYQRDSFLHWLSYFCRFFFAIHVELARYLWRRRRYRLLRRMIVGEGVYWLAVATLMFVNWAATLTVFIVPLILVRVMMMAGNWGQHAFVCDKQPENPYRNSITCINSRYNRRCFNDGYHIAHHLKPNRHWTDLPGELIDNRQTYAEQGAIVFHTLDFFAVWLLLMFKRYRTLARHVVPLGGTAASEEEIIALLRHRTRPLPL